MDYRSLHMKTVADLRKIAKDNGVKLPAGVNKAQIVERILEKELDAVAAAVPAVAMETAEKAIAEQVEMLGVNENTAPETVRAAASQPEAGTAEASEPRRAPAAHTMRTQPNSPRASYKRPNGRPQRATEDYRVELITPPLRYSKDIQTLMEIMKQIVAAGAFVNDTCGIHIHLDGKNHTAQTLKNLCNIVANRTELLDLTLRTEPYRRFHYCKDMDEDFLLEINKTSFLTLEDIEESWYDGWDEPRDKRYHQSRYCFLNLHCYFHGNKTVELRCFNSTLDCEEIRAYIALALGINFLAMTTKYTWYKPVMVDNPRYTMTHFLQRIGLKGSEFASCRQILTRHLTGDPNWR